MGEMTNTSIPPVGSIWIHSSGREYSVLAIANRASKDLEKYPVTVVYKNSFIGSVWSRPVNDWHRSMTRTSLTLS
ncbi:hypothetical protein [Pseudoalteromonas sp.]|uniref:hypothetical protein n=1 Tax=Pseudoalteromonas sp. TaxID=53249 RepID=UPI00257C08A3|nr:hypothetical protein [Pseudoalteromonas sp.]